MFVVTGMGEIIGIAALAILCHMTAAFLISHARRDNGLADVAYGLGFIVAATAAFLRSGLAHPRQVLLLAMVAVWGLRLAIHILVRNWGREEDFRYRAWREAWGKTFVVRSFLQIYLLQGAVILVVLTPVLIVMADPGGPLGALDAAGVLVWGIGLLFEAVGDVQLLRFLRDTAQRGRVLQTGPWRYTRHPNYFGEATLWWGVLLVALGAPHGWAGVVGPLTIAFLLLNVSGIPMLEAKFRGNPEFEDYRARTSAFLPWFPGKRRAGR
jgi:steroid 5-alpha reductase family enzyme